MDKLTLYHGSGTDFPRFSYNYVGKGNDQEGVGFYLTSSMEDAKRYGRFVHVVNAFYRKLVRTQGTKSESDLKYLIRRAPNYQRTLQDWDENPIAGFNVAVRAIKHHAQNPHDMYMQVWYDFYRDNPTEYLKNMVKLGYDGVLIKRPYDIVHFIAFDPDKLKIVK